MEQENQKALWNLDNVELTIIFQIKIQFITALQNWNLEEAYLKIRDLRRELDAKFGRARERFEGIILDENKDDKKKKSIIEKEEVDRKLKELEKVRSEYSKKQQRTEEDKGNYYLALEELYMYLCYLMKKHGLYFREGEDNRMAVLRR